MLCLSIYNMAQIVALKQIPFNISNLETIDAAMFEWLTNTMNLSCDTNRGSIKVPVYWVQAERAFITKNSKERRDVNGALQYPLMVIERSSVTKDLKKKGIVFGNIDPVKDEKGGSTITIARQINQEKSSNFAKSDNKNHIGQYDFPRRNKKIVYETITIPIPVYVEVTYIISIKTLYQQQMNQLVQPFYTRTNGINYFLLKKDGHRYEAFINGEFKNNSNVTKMGEEERKFETAITIKVLGHLIGDGDNNIQPFYSIRENAVEFKLPAERIIFSDSSEIKGFQNFESFAASIGNKSKD